MNICAAHFRMRVFAHLQSVKVMCLSVHILEDCAVESFPISVILVGNFWTGRRWILGFFSNGREVNEDCLNNRVMNFHALIYSHLWIILNNSTPLSRTLNRCDRATFHTSRITTTPTTILYPNISSWLLLSFYKPCNGRKDSVPALHIRVVSSRVPSWNPYIFCIRLEDSGDSSLLGGYGIDKSCKLLLFLCTF